MTQGFSGTGTGGSLKSNILHSLNGALKTALFMESLRNLNWSRGYCWYVELDGVPSPFQRGGVLGLPAKSVSFSLATGEPFTISQFMTDLKVPQRVGAMDVINLDVYDDEQGTLRTFFERWYNQVYNPYKGVLPAEEACKQITIYFQKTTRRNVKRVYYDIDQNINGVMSRGLTVKNIINTVRDGGIGHNTTEGYDFLVFPTESLRLQLSSEQSDIISFPVQLQIAQYINQDFGNPTSRDSVLSALGYDTVTTNANSWLDKLADYI